MASGTVVLFAHGKSTLIVMAGAARFPFRHLGHGHGFALFDGHIRNRVALLAGKSQIFHMKIMAEGDGFCILGNKEDIAAADPSRGERSKQKDRAKEKQK
jgi:hypothetical protein